MRPSARTRSSSDNSPKPCIGALARPRLLRAAMGLRRLEAVGEPLEHRRAGVARHGVRAVEAVGRVRGEGDGPAEGKLDHLLRLGEEERLRERRRLENPAVFE